MLISLIHTPSNSVVLVITVNSMFAIKTSMHHNYFNAVHLPVIPAWNGDATPAKLFSNKDTKTLFNMNNFPPKWEGKDKGWSMYI